ncbi:translocation/assembly module TamB domain-containing protein [Ramlibacter sp. XY19]|uniref:translocation/assembly module TamB domain-containing protein n=1 Tax=Ramlibacter paludis TaxID=2908000 RepID=UPI0023DB7AD9|nr:translocation/assembly module TamB domain-containing protein [Ramlibacter paludis]MCG2594172.1 translocation/assembly module TamB domain-containing protein [Ramlibacter paludis]
MITRHARRVLAWTWRGLLGVLLLLVVSVAGLWWWAGQEGSLEWTLRRVAAGRPLTSEGVRGSLRAGWHIDRIVWEQDGLRLEAQDISLEWQPLALLGRTLRLDQVRVGSARVTDTRAVSNEPLKPPTALVLPWRVTVDEVVVAKLAYVGRTKVEASALAGRYAFDGIQHDLDLKSLQFAGGNYQGKGTLQARGAMELDAKLGGTYAAAVPGAKAPVPLQFDAQLKGPLAQLDANAQLRVARAGSATADLPSATATARITAFDPMPVPQGAADFRRVDLAQFWPAAPRTLLSGHVEVAPLAAGAWKLQADVRNGLAGPWDAQRLPVESAKAEGEWRGGTALVKQLRAQLAGGSVAGEGAWEGDGWRFEGRVDDVDPAGLHTSLASLPLTGPLKLAGRGSEVDFDVALQAQGAVRARKGSGDLQQALAALELREVVAKGRYSGEALTLKPLRVRTSDALLEGDLVLQLASLGGEGKLQLRAPGLQAQAGGTLAETRGNGSITLAANDLATAQQWLRRFPMLREALAHGAVRGRADGSLGWQGGWRDPAVQARVQAKGVEWQPVATAAVQAPPPWVVRDGDVRVDGRLRDAALDVRLQLERGQRKVGLAAAGRVGGALGTAGSWHGQVATLALQVQDPGITPGPWQLQLRRAVDWRAGNGNFELAAGEAVLRAPNVQGAAPAGEALLTWGPVRRQQGQLTSTGKLAGLPLSWIELVGGPQLAGSALAGDLVFDAQWNAQIGANVRVDASLARVRGDVTVLAETADGAQARVAAGVRDARLTLSSQGEQLTLDLLWDSERAGHAQGRIRTRLTPVEGGWEWAEQAPLAGNVKAQLPRIGVWSLLAPPGWRLRGSLLADVTLAGTRAQPQLSGTVQADDLALRSVVDGIELRNGRLRAQLVGQKLVVSEFTLHGAAEGGSDGGSLTARGEGEWTPEGPLLQGEAQLVQLRASIRSDRQLVVSGPVSAQMGKGGTVVTGKLTVDRARITIPDESPPRLGDDVVVREARGVAETRDERKLRPAPTEAGRTVTLTLGLDLGQDFRVSGRGVDTRLAGTLEVKGRSLGLPQITGLIRTVGGTYEAYGQRMNIERGELRFTGPADNPALDVLAIRPNLTQRVGVLVSGRAQAPHVELYSEGGLSEAETLSWLVLGRSSSGDGAEAALLQRAAAALLASRGGTGKGIAGRFGLDDLSVGSSGGSAIVKVGKRFADNFYAAYERSLSGAVGTLYIFYDVSRRLTVRAEAGERMGIDLIYTYSFDRIGGGKK